MTARALTPDEYAATLERGCCPYCSHFNVLHYDVVAGGAGTHYTRLIYRCIVAGCGCEREETA